MTTLADKKRLFGNLAMGLASAGTTQATATAASADHITVTTVTEGGGVRLGAGNVLDFRSVANHDATDGLLVYPPVGAAFNGEATDAALTLPAGKAAWFLFFSSTVITAIAW